MIRSVCRLKTCDSRRCVVAARREISGKTEVQIRPAVDAGFHLADKVWLQYLKRGQPFCTRSSTDPRRPQVWLPLRYMEEVRNASEDELSLPEYTEIVWHSNGDNRRMPCSQSDTGFYAQICEWPTYY